MTEFYQFFVDAVAAGVTRQNHIGTDWNQWYNEVANGRAAFWHGGTWHFGRYAREGNDDFWNTIQFSLIPAGNDAGRANTITHPLVYLVMNQEDDRVEEVAVAAYRHRNRAASEFATCDPVQPLGCGKGSERH